MVPTLQADIDAVAAVDGVNLGGFQTFAGGEESAEVVEDFAPGAKYADKMTSSHSSISNITISRSWVETRDRPLYNRLKGKMNAQSSVSRIVRDGNRNPSGSDPFSCRLIRNKGPEGDTGGGTNKATWELEFAVTGMG